MSGELMLGSYESGESPRGIASYWLFEKRIRELEAISGSVIGATGAFKTGMKKLGGPDIAGEVSA